MNDSSPRALNDPGLPHLENKSGGMLTLSRPYAIIIAIGNNTVQAHMSPFKGGVLALTSLFSVQFNPCPLFNKYC